MKPILFNTEMVKAIHNGTKTVTRRVLKTEKHIPDDAVFGYTGFTPKGYISCRGKFVDENGNKRYGENYIKMPYQKGAILYVRETWAELETVYGHLYYAYKADDDTLHHSIGENFTHWHPSIHMPKEAARIFLRVTGVRVERLQNIKIADVVSEGVSETCQECFENYGNGYQCCIEESDECCMYDGTMSDWKDLWNSTIKKSDLDKYGWNANPWVWAVEFEKINKEEAYGAENRA